MGLIDKAKNGIKTGIQYIGKGAKIAVKTVGEVVTTIKDDVVEARAERELNEQLLRQFNACAHRLTMVTTGEQAAISEVFAQVDYEAKTLTFFGEVENLSSQTYFVDYEFRKYSVVLIRVKQTMDMVIDSTIYPCAVTVVQYILSADADTRAQMQSVLRSGQPNAYGGQTGTNNGQSGTDDGTVSKN